MIPSNPLAKIEDRKSGEDRERDDFLDDLELRRRIKRVAPAIRRHHQDVFKERNAPACEDDRHERFAFEFQMPIPRERHEDIRAEQQRDGKPTGLDEGVHKSIPRLIFEATWPDPSRQASKNKARFVLTHAGNHELV